MHIDDHGCTVKPDGLSASAALQVRLPNALCFVPGTTTNVPLDAMM